MLLKFCDLNHINWKIFRVTSPPLKEMFKNFASSILLKLICLFKGLQFFLVKIMTANKKALSCILTKGNVYVTAV